MKWKGLIEITAESGSEIAEGTMKFYEEYKHISRLGLPSEKYGLPLLSGWILQRAEKLSKGPTAEIDWTL